MIAANDFILNALLNAIWQIPLVWTVAASGAFVLRNASAHYRHILWVVALVFCLVVPVITATRVVPVLAIDSGSFSSYSPETVAETDERINDGDISAALDHTRRRKSPTSIFTTPRIIKLLTVGYGLFIVFALARFVRLWVAKERLRQSASFHGLPEPIAMAVERCRLIFQQQKLQVARSNAARVPLTLGVRQPLIIMPDSFCADLDHDTVISVVAHEMAHVRRQDSLTKIICELISMPISFHPFVFNLKRQIERERELACDELVTRFVVSPNVYARSLLRAAKLSLGPVPRTVMLSIFDGEILEKRIRQLTSGKTSIGRRAGRALAAIVLAVVCASSISLSAFGFSLKTSVDPSLGVSPTPTRSAEFESLILQNPTQKQNLKRAQVRTQADSLDAQARARATCTAARNRDISSIPSLIAMLGDDTKTDLIRCWENSSWSPALTTFKHPSPGEQAALALASMGQQALLPLVQQLDNPNPVVRKNSAWAIGELTNMISDERASAVPRLLSLLRDSDPWVRMAAARALGEVRDRRANDLLIAALSDSEWLVRRLAAWALSELRAQSAVTRLCDLLLTDPQPEVRRIAAEALGEIRSAEALPSLRIALNDSEAGVRAKVSWAIAEIDGDG